MLIDESIRALFLKNKEIVQQTPRLKQVISMKEAIELLETSETSFRRSINNGEYLEEKEDFRKIGASMFFDLESILNRRFMDHETYWSLKDEYDKEQLNKSLFGEAEKVSISYEKSKTQNNRVTNEDLMNTLEKILKTLEK